MTEEILTGLAIIALVFFIAKSRGNKKKLDERHLGTGTRRKSDDDEF